MGIRTTESAVKNHISLEMTRELIAMYRTMYQLWFLVYQRSSSSTTPSSTSPSSSSQVSVLMSTETPKIQCKKEVEVRVKNFGETRCLNPQKPKTKMKMVNQKKYKEIHRMNRRIGYRNSEINCSDESTSTEPWGSQDHGYNYHFFSPSENRCLPASTLEPEERDFVVDSGASMHMISNKDLSDAEMDTLTRSCSPTTVITANGEVQTHEEVTENVKELDLFVTSDDS